MAEEDTLYVVDFTMKEGVVTLWLSNGMKLGNLTSVEVPRFREGDLRRIGIELVMGHKVKPNR